MCTKQFIFILIDLCFNTLNIFSNSSPLLCFVFNIYKSIVVEMLSVLYRRTFVSTSVIISQFTFTQCCAVKHGLCAVQRFAFLFFIQITRRLPPNNGGIKLSVCYCYMSKNPFMDRFQKTDKTSLAVCFNCTRQLLQSRQHYNIEKVHVHMKIQKMKQ